jgi:GR25 family glycosyltransferase involved in LPS biosynthesis
MPGIIIIGSSNENTKCINIDNIFKNNTYNISKSNWVNDDTYNDTFEVTIENNQCHVTRTDTNTGWGMILIIQADLVEQKQTTTIPIFFINLDKDKDRLDHIQRLLNKIFDKSDIHRIPGVRHSLGLEGCRLAHINAHINAINKGFDYYLIAEDDIQPLVDIDTIKQYINDSIKINPDLVLFEQGERLEKYMKLKEVTPNMYRIFGGGNNTGCYLCSKEFGIKLIKHWIYNPGKHVDQSWQKLWTTNNVYFHRPQIFQQKEGYSNQNDVDYRGTIKPFDWNLYEKINIYK